MGRGGKRLGAGRPRGSGKHKDTFSNCTDNDKKPLEVVLSTIQVEEELELWQSATTVGNIYNSDQTTKYRLTLFMQPVSAGFPSPGDDYIEGKLDLNRYLIKHPAATFFVRVTGDSMIDAGIHPGDMLIVDRAIAPADGKIVIAAVNGELTVKRIAKTRDKLLLVPSNRNYPSLQISAEMDFQIWGVVTNVIHPV